MRPHCGVVSAKPALYDRLSGRDNLDYSAELYGVKTDKERRIRDAAGRFGIDAALDDRQFVSNDVIQPSSSPRRN